MAKINIVTGNNSFSVNGVQRGKSRIVVNIGENSVSIGGYHANLEEVEIDGETFADMESLRAALDAKVFKSGGGDGSGVTWNQVTDKPLYTLGTPIHDAEGLIPVYTQNGQLPVGMPEFPENAVPLILLDVRVPELEEGNFLVGGEDGNEQRKIVGTDLNITQTSNNWYVARWNPTNQEWGGTVQLVSPSPNTLVIRTSAGQGKFSPAVNPDEAVVLSQLNANGRYLGLHDTITALETAHPTANRGDRAEVRDIDSTGDIHRWYYWGEMAEAWLPLNKAEDDVYASGEVVTNKIWIDGKKVYRRVFHNVVIEDDGSVLISLAGVGITEITHFDYTVNEGGQIRKSVSTFDVVATNTSLTIKPTGTPTVPTSVTVILEYTK